MLSDCRDILRERIMFSQFNSEKSRKSVVESLPPASWNSESGEKEEEKNQWKDTNKFTTFVLTICWFLMVVVS